MQTANKDSHLLATLAEKIGISFSFYGQELSNDEAFAVDAGLPLFYLAAQEVASDTGLGDIGVAFSPDKQSLFKLEAHLSGDEATNSARMMFCFDVLLECARSMKADNKTTFDLGELSARLEPQINQVLNSPKLEAA